MLQKNSTTGGCTRDGRLCAFMRHDEQGLYSDDAPLRLNFMWVCLNDSFLSVVADRTDPVRRLVVRARRREHLTSLFGPDAEIKVGAGTDYKYRVFADRKTVAALVAEKLQNIQYTN